MKTITSVELAKLAGVSQSTVSRCLNDSPLVSEETKLRVKKIAEEYSFQFNSNARGLKTNRTGVVGYIFSEDFSGFANHYIQSDLYYRIRMQLLPHGLDVVPVFDDLGSGEVSSIEKSISNRRYDALIFNRQSISNRVRMLLEETRIPHIFIYDTNEDSEEPFMIAPLHSKIGFLIGKKFCESGYKHFIEVTGPEKRIDVQHKHAGFVEALASYGFSISEDNIIRADYNMEKAQSLTRANLDKFCQGTAVFVQNDMMALGVLEVLKNNKVRVPEDVSIIGMDNIIMGRWSYPQLTTVAIDYDQIINLTSEWILLVTAKNAPKTYRHFLTGELIERGTFFTS